MYRAYAGVGPEETPPEVLAQMVRCGQALAGAGYTLRSGATAGAEEAFERGARGEPGAKLEISLPWKGYNKHRSALYSVEPRVLRLAAQLHPAWDRVSVAGRRLQGRYCYQVLGRNLNWPSEFLVCWSADGFDSEHAPWGRIGSTRVAIALAIRHRVPVFNLAHPGTFSALSSFLLQRGILIAPEMAEVYRPLPISPGA